MHVVICEWCVESMSRGEEESLVVSFYKGFFLCYRLSIVVASCREEPHPFLSNDNTNPSHFFGTELYASYVLYLCEPF